MTEQPAPLPAALRAALHELRCWECRVTWTSWAQRLIGINRGYTPHLSKQHRAMIERAQKAEIEASQARVIVDAWKDSWQRERGRLGAAEADRDRLADRYRALDAQLTRERQARLAAEAAVRRFREMVAHEIRTGNGASAYTLRRFLEALDAEQPKETP